MATFGERVRALRTEGGEFISLRDLAKRVGVDFTYLSKIENDKVPPPSNEVIRKLARELGADPEELFSLAAKVSQGKLREAVSQDSRIGVLFRKLQSQDLSDEQLERILKIAMTGETSDTAN